MNSIAVEISFKNKCSTITSGNMALDNIDFKPANYPNYLRSFIKMELKSQRFKLGRPGLALQIYKFKKLPTQF